MNMNLKLNRKKKGFTLAELVVVVTIIGILMLIAISRFSSISSSAAERTFEANHRLVVSAITMYMADNAGQIPPASETFANYIADPSGGTAVGLAALQGKPKGAANGGDAAYVWNNGTLTSTFTATGTGAQARTLTYTP